MNKWIVTLSLSLMLTGIGVAETLQINKVPTRLPQNLPLASYSPMLEFEYSDLMQDNYTLKVWLLNPGPWDCASTQICEKTLPIVNSGGNNASGLLRLAQSFDVYNYTYMDFVARLYTSTGAEVAWDEQYVSGVANRPPVLGVIPTQNVIVGKSLEFTASAVDPEGSTLTYWASGLPEGAELVSDGAFTWTPDAEGIYELYISADDGTTYDSQRVTINVGAEPEFSEISIPQCGSVQNVTGRVSNLDEFYDYRVIAYIYISGSGWWVKPYTDLPQTIIQTDGFFEVDITTGGIDELATIVYLGISHKDAVIPLLAGEASIPDGLPVLTGQKYYRSPTDCHRVIEFSGYRWYVKRSDTGTLGPGPCHFSDSSQNVDVDENGYLHLQITNNDSQWSCAEIVSVEEIGYGSYAVELTSDPSTLDTNAVLGLFTWADDAENGKEIDIEYSRWGDPQNQNGQFVIQPWSLPGHIERFEFPPTDNPSTHRFNWQNDKVLFQASINEVLPSTPKQTVANWTFLGETPDPDRAHYRINLWLNDNQPPSDNLPQSVVIKNFRFNAYEEGALLPGLMMLLLDD